MCHNKLLNVTLLLNCAAAAAAAGSGAARGRGRRVTFSSSSPRRREPAAARAGRRCWLPAVLAAGGDRGTRSGEADAVRDAGGFLRGTARSAAG